LITGSKQLRRFLLGRRREHHLALRIVLQLLTSELSYRASTRRRACDVVHVVFADRVLLLRQTLEHLAVITTASGTITEANEYDGLVTRSSPKSYSTAGCEVEHRWCGG